VQGLEFAKSQGDVLVVGIQPDSWVAQKKGPARPIRPQMGRIALIDALGCVDYCFFMPPRKPEITSTMQVLTALNPDTFVCHEEHAAPWDEDIDRLEAMGTELVVDRSGKIESTSEIIRRVIVAHAFEEEELHIQQDT